MSKGVHLAAPADLKYTQSHEWIRLKGKQAEVGITAHAVEAIKDIVFLELPQAGKEVGSAKPFGVIESVKAVFDLNAPLGGKVTEVNSGLQDDFAPLQSDPYGKGWMIKMELASTDTSGLMDAAAYEKFCSEDRH
jgi:glycine cleavage system H protein